MTENFNISFPICDTNVHVYSISESSGNPGSEKTYYQHRHPGLEIHYLLSGQCRINCGGATFQLNKDHILLIPASIYHDTVSTEPDTKRISILFKIQKSNHASSKSNAFFQKYDCKAPLNADLQNNAASHILQRMALLLETKQQDAYRNDKLLALFGSLLLELIPHIPEASDIMSAEHTVKANEDISFEIDSFLGRNFMCNNAKSRIASDLYISPRQLQRIIQKNYGMSYRQKLSETRLEIATDLLCNTDMQIHKISEILGYSNSANFSAFIKRATGKTPSQIRKNNNNT